MCVGVCVCVYMYVSVIVVKTGIYHSVVGGLTLPHFSPLTSLHPVDRLPQMSLPPLKISQCTLRTSYNVMCYVISVKKYHTQKHVTFKNSKTEGEMVMQKIKKQEEGNLFGHSQPS